MSTGNDSIKTSGLDKVFTKIEDKIQNENEFSRAQHLVNKSRPEKLRDVKKSLIKFDINSSHSLRLLEKTGSASKKDRYMQKVVTENAEHLQRATSSQNGNT